MRKEFDRTQNLFAVTFSLPASAVAEASTVHLVGDFNSWGTEGKSTLERQADGSYQTVLHLPPGQEYAFRYLVDAHRWENAHEADAYVASPFAGIDNSVVRVPSAPPAPKAAAAPKAKAPRRKKVKVDDLKIIEGVGPKIATLMTEAGIKTWADMAAAKPKRLKEILQAAGPRYHMHNPSTWPKQAQLAASGDWEALKALQDGLKGGK